MNASLFLERFKKKNPYQAILMGHQANDLAETALKRLFEGAHLHRLFGMQEVCLLEGLLIWRPLLKVPRKAIEESLAKSSIQALLDPANVDPHYLRARMRVSLIPRLEEAFGKAALENLKTLAERSLELDAYLARRVEQIRHKVKRGPFGVWIDAAECERIELRVLLQEILPMSRHVLELLLDWAQEKKAGEISIGSGKIIADRGHLFFLEKKLPQSQEPILLPEFGSIRFGDWKVFVGENGPIDSGWQSLWQKGEAAIRVEGNGGLWISLPPPGVEWKDKSPPFLRKICPCILRQGKVVGNFLSSKKTAGKRVIKIFIDSNLL